MNPALKKLFVVEFRRQWNLVSFAVPVILGVIGYFEIRGILRGAKEFHVAQQIFNLHESFVLPLAVTLFSVGIVANDVRDGWLRTLLIRPITRTQYLLVKMGTAFCSTWITLLFAVTLPILIMSKTTDARVDFDVLKTFWAYVLLVGQSLLYLSILTYFSCWLQSFLNAAFLATWGLAGIFLFMYMQIELWDKRWAYIAKDFLFPSGFLDASGSILSGSYFPTAELLWGISALAFFIGMSFWSINRIEVDKSSE